MRQGVVRLGPPVGNIYQEVDDVYLVPRPIMPTPSQGGGRHEARKPAMLRVNTVLRISLGTKPSPLILASHAELLAGATPRILEGRKPGYWHKANNFSPDKGEGR